MGKAGLGEAKESVRIGILGPLVVELHGREVEVGAAKQRAVLAFLVLRRNEVVRTETLVHEVWCGRPPATATKIIHGYVSQLRKVLGAGVLETLAVGYRLRLAPDEVDATEFEVLLQRGRAALAGADPAAAGVLLLEALALWRGPPLAEFRRHDFAAEETQRLEELHLLALECRLEADIPLGNHNGAIPELQALIHENPLRESLRGLLMLALYRAGRQAEALAVFLNTRTVLVEALGIEPSDAMQRLQTAVLLHDPALDLQPMMPAPQLAGASPSLHPPADLAGVTVPPPDGPTDTKATPQPARRRSRRAVAVTACAALAASVQWCSVRLVGLRRVPEMSRLTPAVIGLIGALIGALIGLSGIWLANRYQALRAERQFRRQVYTDFLAVVMATQKFQERHLYLFESHARHEAELAQAKGYGERGAISEAQREVDADLPLLENNQIEFSNQLERLATECHRLKIAGHPMVWEAAFGIYVALGYCLPVYPAALRDRGRDQVNDCLSHFADVARADVKSPGRRRWRRLRQEHAVVLVDGQGLIAEAEQFEELDRGHEQVHKPVWTFMTG